MEFLALMDLFSGSVALCLMVTCHTATLSGRSMMADLYADIMFSVGGRVDMIMIRSC